MDADLEKFFREIKDQGHLDRTMLVVLADHGVRFSPFRETFQGKLEERLPLLSISVPQWFREKEPFRSLWKTLQENAKHSLITPFDLHQTFVHILELASPNRLAAENLEKFLKFKEVGPYSQATSLFRKISPSRTCPDVDIPVHYCPCLRWIRLDFSKIDNNFLIITNKAAENVVDQINSERESSK